MREVGADSFVEEGNVARRVWAIRNALETAILRSGGGQFFGNLSLAGG